MPQNRFTQRVFGLPIFLTFMLIFVTAGCQQSGGPAAPEPVSAQSYRARVDALLKIAHPENAQATIEKFGCAACHRNAAASGTAPSWDGVAARAAARRSPMPADAYIYESIVFPSAYLVDGYIDIMPKDFGQRMSDQELADVLAYLLTPDAK